MKKSILFIFAIVSFFAISCKKENTPTPEPVKPVVVDTVADIEFLTSSLIPSALDMDSMTVITLRMTVKITARDSDVYMPHYLFTDSLFNDSLEVFKINQRGNTTVYQSYYSYYIQNGATIEPTGNIKINARQTAIISYIAIIRTHANRGWYQLQLGTIPCSLGQDDGIFESTIKAGPECFTEWISTYW